jgi:hypothetical protein
MMATSWFIMAKLRHDAMMRHDDFHDDMMMAYFITNEIIKKKPFNNG